MLYFAFKVVSVFPWYMSIILSPLAYFTTYNVRNTYLFAILAACTQLHYNFRSWCTDHCDGTLPADLAKALIRGNVLSELLSELCYAWHMAGLPDFDMVCFLPTTQSQLLPRYTIRRSRRSRCARRISIFAYYFQARAHLCRVLRPWNMRDIYKRYPEARS